MLPEGGERRVDAVERVVLDRALGIPAVRLLEAVEVDTDPDHWLQRATWVQRQQRPGSGDRPHRSRSR